MSKYDDLNNLYNLIKSEKTNLGGIFLFRLKKVIFMLSILFALFMLTSVVNAAEFYKPLGQGHLSSYKGIPFGHGPSMRLEIIDNIPIKTSQSYDLTGKIGTKVHILEYASWSINFPTNHLAGTIYINYLDGTITKLDLIMGKNIAEWAYDRFELQSELKHDKVLPAISNLTDQDSNSKYLAHLFYVSIPLERKPLDKLELIMNTDLANHDKNFGIGISSITLEDSDSSVPYTHFNVEGSKGDKEYFISSLALKFRASDNLSGVKQTFYSINSFPWQTYTEPFTLTEDGEYTIQYYSVDNAGNVEPTKTQVLRIDRTPPQTVFITNEPTGKEGWHLKDVKVTLEALDNLAGIERIEYFLNDSGVWQIYTGPFEISAEGITNITYRSIDKAGNEELIQTDSVRIDKTPPVSKKQLEGALGDNGWFTSNVNLILSAEDNISGIQTTEYSLDEGLTWYVYANPLEIKAPRAKILVRSLDQAGNLEAPQELYLKIDTEAPVIEINNPQGIEYLHSSSFKVDVKIDDLTSGVGFYIITLDGTEVSQGQNIDLLELEPGQHSLNVKAVDNAGNLTETGIIFEVIVSADSLQALVDRYLEEGLIYKAGIANSLGTKIKGVRMAIDAGNITSGSNTLKAFINEVKAQRGKHIHNQAADILIKEASLILSSL